jgi:hypothetical protein
MGEVQGDDPSRFEGYGRTVQFQMILGIAEALRGEFGVGIDAHPGGEGSEAGAVNRAFLAAARLILEATIPPGGDPRPVLAWALRRAAYLRLEELGLRGGRASALLDTEPLLLDRWLAYLVLAPTSVIEELISGQGY